MTQPANENKPIYSTGDIISLLRLVIKNRNLFLFIVILPTLVISGWIAYKNSLTIYSNNLVQVLDIPIEKVWELESFYNNNFQEIYYPELNDDFPYFIQIDKADMLSTIRAVSKTGVSWIYLKSKIPIEIFKTKNEYVKKFVANTTKKFLLKENLLSLQKGIDYEISDSKTTLETQISRTKVVKDILVKFNDIKKQDRGINKNESFINIPTTANERDNFQNVLYYFPLKQQEAALLSEKTRLLINSDELNTKISYLIASRPNLDKLIERCNKTLEKYEDIIHDININEYYKLDAFIDNKHWTSRAIIDFKRDTATTIIPDDSNFSATKEVVKSAILIFILSLILFAIIVTFRENQTRRQ